MLKKSLIFLSVQAHIIYSTEFIIQNRSHYPVTVTIKNAELKDIDPVIIQPRHTKSIMSDTQVNSISWQFRRCYKFIVQLHGTHLKEIEEIIIQNNSLFYLTTLGKCQRAFEVLLKNV